VTDGILGQALAYAASGWPVFPCGPGVKMPAIPSAHPAGSLCKGECGQDGHGFRDATTDPARIRAWWRRWPDANVAIATGAPGPDVLDVDNRPSGWEAFNRLKRAGALAGAFALIRTRAGGLHVYYQGTSQRCTVSIGGATVDYRAAGGYVVAPPSYVEADAKGPAGHYEVLEKRPMTGAMFDLAGAQALLAPPAPRRRPRPSSPGGRSPDALARWVRENARPGGGERGGTRHESLRWMTKKLADAGQLDDAGAALVLAVAEDIGLAGGEREARAIIRSYGGPA
jgi:Bifunctional DNA primase/polymerase, N-terminal